MIVIFIEKGILLFMNERKKKKHVYNYLTDKFYGTLKNLSVLVHKILK